VVTLIILMAAFALPNIRGYLQLAKIKAGARGVVDEMQRARTLALKKNVNNGMVFYIASTTEYGYYAEDTHNTETGQRNFEKASYTSAEEADGDENAVAAPATMTLPSPIEFVPGGTGRFVRFDRLGRACDPSAVPGEAQVCTTLASADGAPGLGAFFTVDGNDRLLTLRDPTTDANVVVRVSPGGRIQIPR
jgi:Tfp pilus assembly protein FimT